MQTMGLQKYEPSDELLHNGNKYGSISIGDICIRFCGTFVVEILK